jgi:5-methylthioadenosine/S-adenosylhomocysteine deaminase
MLHALKFAALVPNGVHRDPRIMTARQVVHMATLGGARAMGMEDNIGTLEPGKAADIVVFALTNLSITPVHEPVASLVYSHSGDEVRDVWVAVRQVVAAGTPTQVDPVATRERATRAAHALARRGTLPSFGRDGDCGRHNRNRNGVVSGA